MNYRLLFEEILSLCLTGYVNVIKEVIDEEPNSRFIMVGRILPSYNCVLKLTKNGKRYHSVTFGDQVDCYLQNVTLSELLMKYASSDSVCDYLASQANSIFGKSGLFFDRASNEIKVVK